MSEKKITQNGLMNMAKYLSKDEQTRNYDHFEAIVTIFDESKFSTTTKTFSKEEKNKPAVERFYSYVNGFNGQKEGPYITRVELMLYKRNFTPSCVFDFVRDEKDQDFEVKRNLTYIVGKCPDKCCFSICEEILNSLKGDIYEIVSTGA